MKAAPRRGKPRCYYMIQASLLEWNRVIILDSALVLSPPVLISPASIVPIATSVAPVLISPASLAAASLAASLVWKT